MCSISDKSFDKFTKIPGLEMKKHHVTLPLMTEECMMQGSSGNMKTKKGKLCLKVRQVDKSNNMHTLWPVKHCKKAGVNMLSLISNFQKK